MNKKIATIIIAAAIVLTACGNNSDASNDANNESAVAKSTADFSAIHEVQTQNRVEEFNTEEYNFKPATLQALIPDGFEAEEEGLYLSKKYPKDVSSINYIISDQSDDPTAVTKEQYIELLKKEFKEGYGEDIDFDITQYDKVMIDNRPGLWIMYNYDFRGEHYYALSVVIYNGTESHYMTYLQGPGYDWMKDFADSANSISLMDK